MKPVVLGLFITLSRLLNTQLNLLALGHCEPPAATEWHDLLMYSFNTRGERQLLVQLSPRAFTL